jgi:hypothetical protein
MEKSIYIFLLLFICTGFAFAQEEVKSPIVDDLNTPKSGQGRVLVLQDESIKKLVAVYAVTDTSSVMIDWSTVNHVKVNGFKIQVFSGNNHKQSKDEAERKQSLIRESYPGEETTITYNAPFWRLRVGNFLTQAEAEEALKDMKKTFPSFGREMYIVRDVVKRPTD